MCVCMCGHSAVVHHLDDQCSLCLEDTKGKDGCYNYREKPLKPIVELFFKVCDKCSATYPEQGAEWGRCVKCGNEKLRMERIDVLDR